MPRQPLRTLLLLFLLLTVHLDASAQDGETLTERLGQLLQDNDRRFAQLQQQGNDTTGVGVALWQRMTEAVRQYRWTDVVARGREWLDYAESNPMQVSYPDYNAALQIVTQGLLMDNHFTEAVQLLDHARTFVRQNNVVDPLADRYILVLQGEVYNAMKNPRRALQCFNEAKGMYEQVGDNSMFYLVCLSYLAGTYNVMGDKAYVKLFADEVETLLGRMVDGLSEEDREQYMFLHNIATGYLTAIGYDEPDLEGLEQALDHYEQTGSTENYYGVATRLVAAYTKRHDVANMARIMERAGRINTSERERDAQLWAACVLRRDAQAMGYLERLNTLARQDVAQVQHAFGPDDLEAFWEETSTELTFYNNAQARCFPTLGRAQQMAYDNALYVRRATLSREAPTWRDVQRQLADDDVAIEMVYMNDFTDGGIETYHYGALVLRRGYDAPRLVSLCPSDSLSRIWQNVVHTDTALVNRQYALSQSPLYRLAWAPIEPLLREGDHIYYVPTGYLGRINFDVLASNGVRLADRYHLHQLTTTAHIADMKQRRQQPTALNDAAIYGDIAYDATTDEMVAAATTYHRQACPDTLLLATRSAVTDRAAVAALPPLPGTGEEGRQIARLLRDKDYAVKLYEGAEANEESVKALSGCSPHILHIGTHGFILNTSDDVLTHHGFLESVMTAQQSQQRSSLHYSGLMFAGAENVWCGDDVPAGVEDGILTSAELSQLDLSRTRLMVLSACETALEHVNEALGDFGLKRALKMAGVGTLVMSLWEVPDEPTRLLMTAFFTHLLDGLSAQEAIQRARQTVSARYPEPYYWAAFVVVD